MKMNKSDLITKFSLINENSYYISVSNKHPLQLYIGKTEDGFYALRFNGDFVPIKIKSGDILQVKQVKLENHNSIIFSYNSNDDPSLFYSFCEDIINNTFDCKVEDGYIELVNRYNRWKKMFYLSKSILSEVEIIGLIGELIFLKDVVFSKYGQSKGLLGWSGPEPTHKDFSFDNDWYEIKTINSFKKTVTISSIDQLDSEVDGRLVIYTLQKMSPSFDGVKINKLVSSIMDMLSLESDKDLFAQKLKQVGYSYNDIYDDYVYEIAKIDKYIVNKEFPKIKSSQLPIGVGSIKYELIISAIDRFKEK